MCSDYEPCTIFNRTSPKARKPHRCNECGRDIQASERYERIESLFEGVWSTVKVCAHCGVGMDWLSAECGGYPIGMVSDDINEHARDYRRIDLWRLVVGRERKWARFDGAGLMAVPKMPELTYQPGETTPAPVASSAAASAPPG
jgi:hypothetical protein